MRWIGDGSVLNRTRAEELIASFESQWETRGFALLAAALRDGGPLIGAVGLSVPTFLPEILPAVEVGWRLGQEHWGRGFATEAAEAVLHFGFDQLELEQIVSIHQIGNDASERVMQKLSMRPIRETTDPSCQRPVRVHAIDRADLPSS